MQWFKPLRKNLGKSKIFPNAAFGYWKVTVERPLRLRVDLSEQRRRAFRAACTEEGDEPTANVVDRVVELIGPGPHTDFNAFIGAIEDDAEAHSVKLTAKRPKLLQNLLTDRDESAREVLARVQALSETDLAFRMVHPPVMNLRTSLAEAVQLFVRLGVEGDQIVRCQHRRTKGERRR